MHENDSIPFKEVLGDELGLISRKRDQYQAPQKAAGESIYRRARAMNLAGLAFSGGGYIGGRLSAMLRRPWKDAPGEAEVRDQQQQLATPPLIQYGAEWSVACAWSIWAREGASLPPSRSARFRNGCGRPVRDL